MAVKCSSSGGDRAMKARLALMLLVGAVVAAHAAQEVEVENSLCKVVVIEGRTINAGDSVKVTINKYIHVSVIDAQGKVVSGTYMLPTDVSKIRFVNKPGKVYMVVNSVTNMPMGLLSTLVGKVVGVLDVFLRC